MPIHQWAAARQKEQRIAGLSRSGAKRGGSRESLQHRCAGPIRRAGGPPALAFSAVLALTLTVHRHAGHLAQLGVVRQFVRTPGEHGEPDRSRRTRAARRRGRLFLERRVDAEIGQSRAAAPGHRAERLRPRAVLGAGARAERARARHQHPELHRTTVGARHHALSAPSTGYFGSMKPGRISIGAERIIDRAGWCW
jgi:hypothetical protein